MADQRQLPRHSFAMEASEWKQFATAVKATSPELTCSMALRELARYWMDPDVTELRIGWPPIERKTTAA